MIQGILAALGGLGSSVLGALKNLPLDKIFSTAAGSLLSGLMPGGSSEGGSSENKTPQIEQKQSPGPLMGFPSVSNTNYGDIVKAVVNRQKGLV